jgi:hypothetical protein
MLRFDFYTTNTVHLPTPHDPIFQLEAQLDQTTHPRQRHALLYNDAKNYETGKIQPWKGWYEKRLPILQEYATLDWLALGEHIGAQTHCQAIHTWLRLLTCSEKGQFDLSLFCRTLSKIDYLWHTILPSQLSNLRHPGVKTLLTYFEIQHT